MCLSVTDQHLRVNWFDKSRPVSELNESCRTCSPISRFKGWLELHVLLPETPMWHCSMTNVRPLQLVIVCSTGADYGSLLAPLRGWGCVWVGGWGWRGETQSDMHGTIWRTLICDSKFSLAARACPCPAAGHMWQLLSVHLIAEHSSFHCSTSERFLCTLQCSFICRPEIAVALHAEGMSVHQAAHTVFSFPLWTFQPQGKTRDYCSCTASQAFSLPHTLLSHLSCLHSVFSFFPRLHSPLWRLCTNNQTVCCQVTYCMSRACSLWLTLSLCFVFEIHIQHVQLFHSK